MKFAIIGGGIAGLSAAYYLDKLAKNAGHEIEIQLFERADYWGGKIITIAQDGFVIEGGPDAYLTTKPWMRTLAHELGLEQDLQGTNPENSLTYILHKDELMPIPTGLTMTIPTEFRPIVTTKLLSIPEKLRMGFDLILPPKRTDDDETLAGFISRRLGRAAYERLVGPLLSGIYAGDGDRLSLLSTFPFLKDMEIEYGGLIKGALALRGRRTAASSTNGKNPGASIFESPKAGLGSIADRLVQHLIARGVEMRLKTPVKRIARIKDGYRLLLPRREEVEVDGVIVATPAFAAGKLLRECMPALAKDLSEIEYVTTATVSLAFLKDEMPSELDGYGYIVPEHEDSMALACTWTSSKWEGRAPETHALVRVFLGRVQDDRALPEDEGQLVTMALEELKKTMHIGTQPSATWVFRWEKAMPQYNLGHRDRMARIEKALTDHPGLALSGNGYSGIGMPDCVRSGIDAAEKMMTLSTMEKIGTEYSKVN